LDRHLAGNRGALAVVRVPSEAEEAARGVSRQRQSLVRDRVRFTLRGKGIARLRGIALPPEWWRERAFVRLDLPADLREQLSALRRVILSIDAEAVALTTQIEAAAPAALPAYLGPLTWEILRREVGDWSRFANRRQLHRPLPQRAFLRCLPSARQHQSPRQSPPAPYPRRGRLAASALPAGLSARR